jgi:hypothetical protein
LVKHARLGQVHLSICTRHGYQGVEVLSLDRGPGIRRIEECLKDGYSTQGSSGTGLGAIARLADEFDAYSQEGKGTCIVARVYPSSATASAPLRGTMTIGAIQVPVRGERECGDNWGFRQESDRTVLMLADGLGHGVDAAAASDAAVSVLKRARELDPAALLEQIHQALRSTRGAAVAVASVELERSEVRFAGIGNISSMIILPTSVRHLVSHNGTAGHNVRRFQEFVYPWSDGALLLMHSDGITTSWRLDAYPSLIRRDPSLMAAILFRDASRGRDDACVIVARAEK